MKHAEFPRSFGARLRWVVPACASLAAACALDLSGEQFVGADAGVVAPGTLEDEGGSSSDGGTFDPQDAAAYSGGDGAGRDRGDGAPGSKPAPGSCDFTGTWGSLLTVDVSWAPQGLNIQTFILAPGSGTIKQWIKGVRVQHGTSLEDTTVVCGIELPDFHGTQVVAGQTYGVLFPDSLFDNMYLPSFDVDAVVTSSAPGAKYSASSTAALLGLTMANPTTDPWPATVTTATDPENDGTPGVTVSAAEGLPAQGDGGPYSYFPVGIPAPFQPVVFANKLHLAIRQVTTVTASVVDCDHISGRVSIPQIAGQYAIDSHVIGCELLEGGLCTDTQAAFVDNTQPVFTPSGATTFQSLRLPPGATCASVRSMLQ
jgi:hypothetical protein